MGGKQFVLMRMHWKHASIFLMQLILVVSISGVLLGKGKDKGTEKVQKTKPKKVNRVYKGEHNVYVYGGYPILKSFSNNPDYVRAGELFPLDAISGQFTIGIGYKTGLLGKMFLKNDKIITGIEVQYTNGKGDAEEGVSGENMSIKLNMIDSIVYVGYRLWYYVPIIPVIGLPILNYQKATGNDVEIFSGVGIMNAVLIGVKTEISVYERLMVNVMYRGIFYIYKDSQNLSNSIISLGIGYSI